MLNARKKDWSFLYPLLLGACAFFLTVGFAPLNPNNADWILGRLDPTQHYLGWLFFRNGPWTFPVGLNPLFGLDLSSSIVYSDSIPLLAIPLKVFDPLLPERFQYLGLWIFACFLLQAWVSWKILGIYSQNTTLKLLGCGLFIFFPPMLWRINTPAGGHSALVAHFLILWAIYLILRPTTNKRTLLWIGLLTISVLTHFYLFAIVSMLWASDLANHYFIQRDISAKKLTQESLLALVCVIFLAWQSGYFSISASLNNERGYGFYGMNILGPIDSQGWSYILKSLTKPSSWGEGFSYLGLGITIAGITAIMASIINSRSIDMLKAFSRYRFLIALCIFMTIFAISNHVGIGDTNFTYSLPPWFLKIADALRSSARLFWPTEYLLIVVFYLAIVRAFPLKISYAILALCLATQIVDTSAGWLRNRQELLAQHTIDDHTHNLSNSFWSFAGNHYDNLIIVPSINRPPNWEIFSTYAIKHKMGTNAIHMARVDLEKEKESNNRLNEQINNGTFNQTTLYVIDNRFVIAALASAPSGTAIAKVDTFNVIAPGWNACQQCPPIDLNLILTKKRFEPKLGQAISFANSNPDRGYYLRNGWSWPEDWGTWSDSKTATLNFMWPSSTASSLRLHVNAFVVANTHPIQDVEIKVNGIFYKKLLLDKPLDNMIEIIFTPQMKNSKYLSIEFEILHTARPKDLILDQPDNRNLGIGVVSATFQ